MSLKALSLLSERQRPNPARNASFELFQTQHVVCFVRSIKEPYLHMFACIHRVVLRLFALVFCSLPVFITPRVRVSRIQSKMMLSAMKPRNLRSKTQRPPARLRSKTRRSPARNIRKRPRESSKATLRLHHQKYPTSMCALRVESASTRCHTSRTIVRDTCGRSRVRYARLASRHEAASPCITRRVTAQIVSVSRASAATFSRRRSRCSRISGKKEATIRLLSSACFTSAGTVFYTHPHLCGTIHLHFLAREGCPAIFRENGLHFSKIYVFF